MNSCTFAFLNSNGKNLYKKVMANSFHSTGIGSAYPPSTGYTRCGLHPTTGVAGKMFIDSPERNSAFDYKAIANDIFRANISYYLLLFHVRPYCPAAIPSRLKNSTSETGNVLCFFWEAEDLAEVEAQLDADLKANGGATKDKNQIDVVSNTRIRRALRRVSFTIPKISDVDCVDRSTHSYSKDGIPDAQDAVRVDLVGGFALQKVTDNRSYFSFRYSGPTVWAEWRLLSGRDVQDSYHIAEPEERRSCC
ncbi:hypothetical protein CQW23_01144 [Capsicum baccatum]|uniref:Uncharacterized protein n=1 Tax=Capsicum baccatum TaxID=33114 RepID=A0A2G2XN51_CAPBA|nr:hypothetical protein CQW23_01144 [Capsicum baccatum]